MAVDDVKEQAKAEIRRSVWASQRGIATRTYIRENPEVTIEFNNTGTITTEKFPEHVTKASVLLELHMRARKKEAAVEVRKWAEEHPEEMQKIRDQVQEEYNDEQQPSSSSTSAAV